MLRHSSLKVSVVVVVALNLEFRCDKLQAMAEIRRATVEDAGAIAEQRVRMFEDAGLSSETKMVRMLANFIVWVRGKLEDGSYAGWLVEEDGRLVGGAGLWVMDWPPHFLDDEPRRAYLLNFYVAPEMRRRGLAHDLLALAVAESKARGVKVVTLHASKFGKLVYEQNGFKMSNEMMLRFDDPAF
jgi:ribosomal protein S18 acetylase RimI-like enzyme